MASSRRPRKSASGRSTRARRGKLAPSGKTRGPDASHVALDLTSAEIAGLVAAVGESGGVPLAAYHEPLNGRPMLLASLPLAAVMPTPFQRDLSPTHARRLAERIEQSGVFLDPLIVVQGADGKLWTPNGRHRLAAAKYLGLARVTALVCPDEHLAYRILALNTEKAHNLKDRSLEVVRMARSLAARDSRARESAYAAEFEAPELLTLGLIYERDARFAGGAYSAFLKKVDRFQERGLGTSLREREGYAARLREIDRLVKRIVTQLHTRGLRSPYLRNYVVARINPVRFHKVKRGASAPAMPLAQALTRMTAAARGFDVRSVSGSELAWMAAGAEGGRSEG